MKNVLILTYYWPPGAGPGVQRWLKFSKYLPEYGWNPMVITVKNGSYPSTDPSLLKDVPDGLKVIRTSTIEPFAIYNALRGKKGKSIEVGMGNIKGKQSSFAKLANYVRANGFIPDARMGWNHFLYPKAKQVIKSTKIDAVVTTGPPHSTHLVGMRLKKEFGITWIADFRDPWTNIYYNEFLMRSERADRKDKRLEDEVVQTADSVLSASPGIEEEFKARAAHIQTIPNGYDEEDMPAAHEQIAPKFTLSYVGNLKPNQNTETLWKAIAELATDPSFEEGFELSITGNIHDSILKSWSKTGIDHLVSIKPFVPHAQAVQRMYDSHVLLLPIPTGESSRNILTGKIFEYLATQRPILSIGPTDGNAAKVMKNCDKEPMLDYQDLEGMKALLRKYFEAFKEEKQPASSGNENYKQFSRKGTAGQLSEMLNTLTSS